MTRLVTLAATMPRANPMSPWVRMVAIASSGTIAHAWGLASAAAPSAVKGATTWPRLSRPIASTLNSEWAPSGWAQWATSNRAAGFSTYRLPADTAAIGAPVVRRTMRKMAIAVSTCHVSATNLIASCSHELSCAARGSKLGSCSQRYTVPTAW